MKLVLASANEHKLRELRALLPAGHSLVSLAEVAAQLPEETGTTLAENARLKALAVARQSGLPALSDDTGLMVDFLQGAPGVYTARYAGKHADAEANNQKLLAALQHVPDEKRTARFSTVACIAWPDGKTVCFTGSVEGSIAHEYRGTNGFGYDPVFIVCEKNKTFAELSPAEKNEVSHRARALRQVASYLNTLA